MPTPRDVLRLVTCGSVDDGKSTLIGRLLLDTRSIVSDQVDAAERASAARGDERLDLALFTDGLRAEREQGITIDIAYRHFSTPRRRFIIADAPGHAQYTRNMATGASTADVAVILVDVRHGVVEQTSRHAAIVALLGVPRIVLCVNKMDLAGFSRAEFERRRDEFLAFALGASPDGGPTIAERCAIECVPVAALEGDNIVGRSPRTPWHGGPSLLEALEAAPAASADPAAPARFPIQWVIRPQRGGGADYRGYAGTLSAGTLAVGDEVLALPSGLRSRITAIHLGERGLASARAPRSVALTLADDLDIGRGETLVGVSGPPPTVAREVAATLLWMSEAPLVTPARLLLKHATRTVPAAVSAVERRLDISTMASAEAAGPLALNEIARVSVRLGEPIVCDPYRACRDTGSFILIDPRTNDTVAAGMIASATPEG